MDTSTGNFREKLDELFPGAILEGQFVERAVRGLKSAGFSGENSIACVGVCRDELCDPFVHEVIARFGPTFGMRGLGGFLSCGNTGFGAAHAHSPVVDGRRRFVYFVAPHIAIDELGAVGSVQRPGITLKSSACGALRAFASEMESGKVDLKLDLADLEQSMLKQALAAKLTPKNGRAKRAADCEVVSLAELTKLAERVIAKDQLQTHIDTTVDTFKADYAVVAGIQVHGPQGETYFCQVPEHCITCVKGKVSPLRINGNEQKANSRISMPRGWSMVLVASLVWQLLRHLPGCLAAWLTDRRPVLTVGSCFSRIPTLEHEIKSAKR